MDAVVVEAKIMRDLVPYCVVNRLSQFGKGVDTACQRAFEDGDFVWSVICHTHAARQRHAFVQTEQRLVAGQLQALALLERRLVFVDDGHVLDRIPVRARQARYGLGYELGELLISEVNHQGSLSESGSSGKGRAIPPRPAI